MIRFDTALVKTSGKLATFYLDEETSSALLERINFRDEPAGANLWLALTKKYDVPYDVLRSAVETRIERKARFPVLDAGKATMGMKAAGGKNIDAILRKHGEKVWDRILFEAYKSILSRKERHVIAACPRQYDRWGFWTATAKKAHSIHLAGNPLPVLSRDMKNGGIEKNKGDVSELH